MSLRPRAITRAALLVTCASTAVLAQQSAKRAQATRLSGAAPRIDGRLDDAAWSGADVSAIEDFTQQRPIEGSEPSERTRVVIRYDAQAIYVGARMYRQRPSEILRSVGRRDGQATAEHLQITFDTHRDPRTRYGFVITASGLPTDSQPSRGESPGPWPRWMGTRLRRSGTAKVTWPSPP